MIYTKYMPFHTIRNASRNNRELSVAVEQGYRVYVFSDDNNDSIKLSEGITLLNDGVIELSYSMPKIVRLFLIAWNIVIVFLKTCALRTDVLSCHDLKALKIAYIATAWRPNRPKLIYDSHEYEIGRNVNRTERQKQRIIRWEKYLIKKCTFSIVVNDTIADELVKIYRLQERPVVIRSTPSRWDIDESICEKIHKYMIRDYEDEQQGDTAMALEDKEFIIMYHGAVTQGRGIETLIEVVKINPNIKLFILGDGSENYIASLKKKACEELKRRVVFHPAVSHDELWKYVGAADVGMVTIPATCQSYYYMLPNKFLENIQCLTPIIGSDFPELRKIVDRYKIGLLCDPTDVNEINQCIERMRKDYSFYRQCKENMRKAKQDLCWENEKKVLISAMNKYL